jgi:hypothetical protein
VCEEVVMVIINIRGAERVDISHMEMVSPA